MSAPLILSLCSGYGGLDLAVEAIFDAVTIAHAEYEAAPSKVLATRWPGVPNLGDITRIDWDQITADIITAGYPCQPFSLGGKRKGKNDERHIWPDVAEAIRRVRPRYVVLENVAGHRSLGLDAVLGDLATLGYDAQWTSLRAADVGATHGRERIFILAADTRGEAVRLRPGLRASEPAGQRGRRPDDNPAPLAPNSDVPRPQGPESEAGHDLPARRTLADTDRHGWPGRPEATPLGRTHGDRSRPDDQGRCDVASADTSSDGRDERRPEPTRFIGGSDAAEPGRAAAPDADRNALRVEPVAEPRRGGETVAGHAVQWGLYEPAIRRWEHVLGRVAPAPTETGPKGGQRLSPRFVEWMMGLPAGWCTDIPGLSRNELLKMLGNGVVPQQAAQALVELLAVAESLDGAA